MNKKVLIGLGVLAVAGVAFYMWKKKKDEKSSESETKPEEKANARGATTTNKMCCTEPLDANGYCNGNWISCLRASSAFQSNNQTNTLVGNLPLTERRRWVRNKYDAELKAPKF